MLRSETLRQLRQLQKQLEKDGLTLVVYDSEGKEVDVSEALDKLKDAEKLAGQLGLEMVFRNPSANRRQKKKPQTTGQRKTRAKKSDGRTRYSNALKRIMKEEKCDRKKAQEIYRENQNKAQGGKKNGVSRQKAYVQKVRQVMEEKDCSYHEAQKILKAAKAA